MKRIRKFLEWFLDDSIKEAVIGDLYELYDFEKEEGVRFTSLRFTFRALSFIRRSLYKKTIRFTTLTEALIRSSLSMSKRRLLRQPLSAVSGFFGLTLGVVCLGSLITYVVFSFSFDRHLPKNIHRIVMDVQIGEVERKVAVVPAALHRELISSGIPATRLRAVRDFTLNQGTGTFNSSQAYHASPEFTELFEVRWEMKIHDKPLTEPNFIYVSERLYSRLDTGQHPISLKIGNGQNVILGGVFKDFPENAHLHAEILLPIVEQEPQWTDWNWITYAAADEHTLGNIVENLYDQHMKSRISSMGASLNFQFQPLREIYFSEPRDFDSALHAKRELITGLAVVAVLIGGLIGSNYIFQLLTRSQMRKKELQVRSIAGAYRTQQQWVFALESCAELGLTFCAASVLILLNEQFGWVPAMSQVEVLWIAVTCLFMWFLSFLLNRMRPAFSIRSITNDFAVEHGLGRFFLLWFQFTLSIGLLAGMYVVSSQIHLLSEKDPGYNRDQVIDFVLNEEESSAIQEAVTALEAFSGVKGVTISEQTPGTIPPVNGFSFNTADGNKQQVIAQAWVNEDFFEVLEVPLISGGPLSAQRENAVIVNEQFLKLTGLSINEVLNSPIMSGDEWSGTIIGIVKDFHFTAMDQMIEPMVYRYEQDGNHMLVRLTAKQKDLLPDLLFTLNQINEYLISDYAYLDSKYDANYASYHQQRELLRLATILAFALCAMGLWSSVLMYATKKQKSLSIHKIHGAPTIRLWRMLFVPFLLIILTSIPVAFYAAFAFGENWLSSFPYRIDWPIKDWLAMIGAVIILLLATLLIRSKKIWAANPAHILKSE